MGGTRLRATELLAGSRATVPFTGCYRPPTMPVRDASVGGYGQKIRMRYLTTRLRPMRSFAPNTLSTSVFRLRTTRARPTALLCDVHHRAGRNEWHERPSVMESN